MAASVETPDSRQSGSGKASPGPKSKSAKRATTRVVFPLATNLNLALRLAALQLEIAGEPIGSVSDLLQEMVREKLSALAKAKRVDFSSLAANGLLPNRSPAPEVVAG